MSLPPQSRAEVDPFERDLRLLDDRIRIVWEPKAVLAKHGGYDAVGKIIDPVWDGRWAVVLKGDPFRTASWREDSRICLVTVPTVVGTGTRKIHAMREDGPYAPVGAWLVEVLRSWDRANREAARETSAILDRLNAKADAAVIADAQAGEEERLEAMFVHGTMRGGVSAAHPVAIDL